MKSEDLKKAEEAKIEKEKEGATKTKEKEKEKDYVTREEFEALKKEVKGNTKQINAVAEVTDKTLETIERFEAAWLQQGQPQKAEEEPQPKAEEPKFEWGGICHLKNGKVLDMPDTKSAKCLDPSYELQLFAVFPDGHFRRATDDEVIRRIVR